MVAPAVAEAGVVLAAVTFAAATHSGVVGTGAGAFVVRGVRVRARVRFFLPSS
jgi:Mn2+/Fe2+ NRAMP family transporter